MSTWRDQAQCLDTPLEWWYPDTYDSWDALSPALALCATCPVRQKCLDDALNQGELLYGIRGGLTPMERMELDQKTEPEPDLCIHCMLPLPQERHKNAQVHDECRHEYRIRRKRERRAEERAQRPPRTCGMCGADLTGRDPRAKFCEPCARLRDLEQSQRYVERRRENNEICEGCGKPAPLTKPMHARCARERGEK